MLGIRVLLSLVLLSTLSISSIATAQPVDIEKIDTIYQTIQSVDANRLKSEMKRPLTDLVISQAQGIATLGRFGEESSIYEQSFRDYVGGVVSASLNKTIKGGSNTEKRSSAYKALRIWSTQITAETVLSAWLGLEQPEKRAKSAVDISKVTSISSSNGELKVKEGSVMLLSDIGGSGTANGIFDAGEWVNIGLEIYNDARLPYFSSSYYTYSGDSCIWVADTDETVMPELVQKTDSEPEYAPLSMWAYISTTCRNGTWPKLQVKVSDTHRNRGNDVVLSVALRVTNTLDASPTPLLFDSDVPGSSDGSLKDPKVLELEPSLAFELSHGFDLHNSKPVGGHMDWVMGDGYKQLVQLHEYSSEREMVVVANTLLPGDDADFELRPKQSYQNKLNNFAETAHWESPDDAVVWIASDVTVLLPPPYRVSSAKQEPKSKPETSPLSAAAVMKLAASTTSLEPRPATPLSNGAFEASDGYEIVMNESKFMYKYSCALNSVNNSMCNSCQTLAISIDQCVECASKGLTAQQCESGDLPVEETQASAPSHISYAYRQWFPFQVDWTPQIGGCTDTKASNYNGTVNVDDGSCIYKPGCKDRKATNYDRTAKLDDGSCTYATPTPPKSQPQLTKYRLEIGLSTASAKYINSSSDSITFDPNFSPMYGRARIALDIKEVGVNSIPLRLNFLVLGFPATQKAFYGSTSGTLGELMLSSGLSVGMSPNDTIEIEPHLLAGLMLYNIDAGSLYGRGTTGVIEIGAAAHILVDSKFGFNLTTGLRKIGSAVGRYGSPIVTPNLGYISFNSELRW